MEGKWEGGGVVVFLGGTGGGQEKNKSRWSDVQCEVHLATTSEPPVELQILSASVSR